MVVKCVCCKERERGERGKEWRFEAPAKRICLAAVSFRRVKDYGRITTNEQEDPHTHTTFPLLCVCVCVEEWVRLCVYCTFIIAQFLP